MKKAAKKSAVKKTAAQKRIARRSPAITPSKAIDQQLARYRSMRDFAVTAEPSGDAAADSAHGSAAKGGLPFVIQKHAASHLHYDFRLGWNGVLKSWACAKGPSYFPGDRRLAVQVEDHPMEYGGFEGIIPQGQYGGGTVMLWDEGTWEPQAGHSDVDAGLRAGSLKFTMHGTKMKGNWTLVRMGGKAANEKKPNWLLIKEHDGLERGADNEPITEELPNSVATDRSLEQIAAQKDHVWNSHDPRAARPDRTVTRALVQTPQESFPPFLPPQLASQVVTPPATDGWLHELKLDGYRIQARKQGSRVELLTRSGLDWTHRMKPLAAAVARLPAKDFVLDGEVVVLSADGTTSFADLQAAVQDKSGQDKSGATLTYFAFDLLHLDSRDLRGLPLLERKSYLEDVLRQSTGEVRLSEHLDVDGRQMFHRACELHAEGIVSKRADGRYVAGRSTDWLKSKCIREQEFVVGGFTLPAKAHNGLHGVGALLLGYYDDAGRLVYAGRTGTGFTQKIHRALRTRLEELKQPANPFSNAPPKARRGAVWVKPRLVAQVRFATWTADGLLRQASFQGLREDKQAKEVRREEPSSETSKPKRDRRGAQPAAAPTPVKRGAKMKSDTPAQAPIRLTHPEKVIDPESGITKQQLADYYWAIAPHMLPYIAGRPLSIVRCPEGSSKPCFFQKHTSAMLPAGIDSVAVPDKKTGEPASYITVSTAEALAGLAQIGVLEVHPWGSRNDDLEHPDRIIIDLDPDGSVPWATLTAAAAEVRERLKRAGLESFLKSTGGKGLHVVAPIEPVQDWAAVKQFAHKFVLQLEKDQPLLYLTKMSKAARKDRIYLDYLRNERGATAVAVFSPRARAEMPVSLPLAWTELKLAERPVFPLSQFESWKSRLSRDPWKRLLVVQQRISV